MHRAGSCAARPSIVRGCPLTIGGHKHSCRRPLGRINGKRQRTGYGDAARDEPGAFDELASVNGHSQRPCVIERKPEARRRSSLTARADPLVSKRILSKQASHPPFRHIGVIPPGHGSVRPARIRVVTRRAQVEEEGLLTRIARFRRLLEQIQNSWVAEWRSSSSERSAL